MPIVKPVDLTKPSLDWRWLLSFVLIMIVLLILFGFAMWVKGQVVGAVAGPKGSKRRLEERKI